MPVLNHPIAGRVPYERLKGGRLRLLESWDDKNIGVVHIPQLKGVATYGGRFSGNVQWYKPAMPQLVAAWKAVEREGFLDQVIFWAGSWVPRLKRGGTTPSNHTVATAFDINPDQNGFKARPADKGEKGYLGDVARTFKRYGFFWGGDWKRTPDGMHIEVVDLLSSRELAALEQSARPSEPVPPAKPEPKIVIVRNVNGAQKRYLLNESELRNDRFYAPAGDIVHALYADRGVVPVRDFLQRIGVGVYEEKDFIDEQGRYELYI